MDFGRALVFATIIVCALAPRGVAQVVQLDPQFVTAARAPQAADSATATSLVIEAEALRRAPTLTLDGALRSVPGFSLFRRSDSLIANPTAQGVSLRGLGPSGASRSLVLLDGVPLNDPFGGWVAWTKVPREGLSRAELVPGGGASAWGNAALSGVVHLLGQVPTANTAAATAMLGDFGTRSVEFALPRVLEHDTLTVRGRLFSTDGFSLVAPERRGPIDIAAWSRHRWANASWGHAFGPTLRLGVSARAYQERRGNGTPYQQNSTRERFVSVHAAGETNPDFRWNAVGYAQSQSFASTFSSVNATRTAETPASDQFAVPASAVGAAWTGTWRHDGSSSFSARTNAGVDARFVRGETRENFTFTAGNFTRQRLAGGQQRVAGVFAFHERQLVTDLHATLGLRADHWTESDGTRREYDRISGATLRSDRYSDRDGTAFSPSAGVVWRPHRGGPRLRAHVQRAYRRPTLNELYRPFRVGANVTEANADLRTERATSAEIGAEWSSAGAPTASGKQPAWTPAGRLTFAATGFTNDLRDAVGNVTIARGPGTFPIVGVIAAGGVGRQRLNLDRIRVQGVELSAKWSPTSEFILTGDYLYNDATVRRTTLAPGLVGKRVAQVPRDSAALGAQWRATPAITVTPRVRWIGKQFEDDENQLTLGEVVVADLSVGYALSRSLELFVSAENLGNARIETGRSADGIVNTGTPRLLIGGLRGSW